MSNKPIFEQLRQISMTEGMLEQVLNSARSSDYNTVTKEASQRTQWRKFVPTEPMKKLSQEFYGWTFDMEFIPRANRKAFKDSVLYKKFLSPVDIARNYELFDVAPLVFIGGQIMSNVWIYAHEDITYVTFKLDNNIGDGTTERLGLTEAEIKQLIADNPPVAVFFMPNNTRYTRNNMNGATLKNYKSTGTPIHLDGQFLLDRTGQDSLRVSDIKPDIELDHNVGLVGMSTGPNMFFKYNPVMVSSRWDVETRNNIATGLYSSETVSDDTTWIRIFSLQNSVIFDSTMDAGLINPYSDSLEPYRGLSFENAMYFRAIKPIDPTKPGVMMYLHQDIPEAKYPGYTMLPAPVTSDYQGHPAIIHHILVVPRVLEQTSTDAYSNTNYHNRDALYNDVSANNIHSGFKNEKYLFELSRLVNVAYRDHIKANTLPEEIRDYSGISFRYNIDAYVKSPYYSKTDADRALQYKIRTMMDIVRQDPYYYSQFLKKIVGPPETYFIRDTVEVWNNTRIRLDNRREITNPALQTTFRHPHYLFILRRDDNYSKLIFTLNGKNVVPKVYSDELYHYCYFAHADVVDRLTGRLDSELYMEIEKVYDYRWSARLGDATKVRKIADWNGSGVAYEITVPENSRITPRDIYFSCAHKTTGKQIFIPMLDTTNPQDVKHNYRLYEGRSDSLKLEISTKELEYISYKKVIFKVDINLGLISQAKFGGAINTDDIMVYMDRHNVSYHKVGNNLQEFNDRLNPDKRNLQIFKNGLLVPESAYEIYYNDNDLNGPHSLKALMNVGPDDVFTFVYSRNKREVVYSQKLVPLNGFVDLFGKINKPLSFQWHDFYLNGKKLSRREIVFLTPFKMLLKNVQSAKNFIIYQKNLDLGTSPVPHHNGDGQALFGDVQDIWFNKYNWIKDNIIGDNRIRDNLPDILTDAIVDIYKFLKRHLRHDWGLLNPDLQQITDDMITNNKSVFDGRTDVYVDPDAVQNFDKDYIMNPDTYQDII